VGAPEPALDVGALERLYAQLERPLYNVAYHVLWSAEDSQEVVQEAFLRVWRMRERVRMDSVEPLLYRIVVNLARSRLRHRRVWRWVSLQPLWKRAATDPTPEQELARAGQEDRLRRAVDDLPRDLREVILLCEFSGLSYRQVGDLVGVPEGTVGSRRHRAIAHLRTLLGDEGRD
jgi:RNA polymerase sigma-70 factor (ECF subfamily)